ncbi:MAG: hypothetical protein KDD35_00665 [Bdellovibrionales bacterium]|nr:hypothetical protein [Bdellovibrionales bacterium]
MANWWMTLKNIIEPENFEFDGMIFSLYSTDLERSFMYWDDELGFEVHPIMPYLAVEYAYSWNSQHFPKHRSHLTPNFLDRFILLDTKMVDSLERGDLRLSTGREWQPYIWNQLSQGLWPQIKKQFWAMADDNSPDPNPLSDFHDVYKLQYIQDFKLYAKKRKIPIIVTNQTDKRWDAREFSQLVGGRLISGDRAYNDISVTHDNDLFIAYDGHFTQKGSDHWAQFMVDIIQEYLLKPQPVSAQSNQDGRD